VISRSVDTSGAKTNVYVTISSDGGQGWGNPIQLSTSPYEERNLQIAASGSVLVAAWVVQTAEDHSQLEVTYSTDNGQSWSSPTVVREFGGMGYEGKQSKLISSMEGFDLFFSDDGVSRYTSADGATWVNGLMPVFRPGRSLSFSAVSLGGDDRHIVSTYDPPKGPVYPVYTRGGRDNPTQLYVIVSDRSVGKEIRATGFLHPAESGMPIRVTLLQKRKGLETFRKVASKPSRTKGDGSFLVSFPDLDRGRCIFRVSVAGDSRHTSAQADTDLFQCDDG